MQQILGIGPDISAHIQHDVKARWVARRPQNTNRGAVHPWNFAQPQHRQRHQRARVATRHSGPRLAVFHGLNRAPHRAAFGVAHYLRGFGIHRDHIVTMANVAAPLQVTAFGNQFVQGFAITMHDEPQIRVLARSFGHARNNGGGAKIAPHCINR